MWESFDKAGRQLIRSTGQVPVSLPAAGCTVAGQEHVAHLQITTFAEAHSNRKHACLLGIRQCAANAHDLRWGACRNTPRLFLVKPEEEETSEEATLTGTHSRARWEASESKTREKQLERHASK